MHYASIEDLTRSFGIREIFNSISFHVEEGDKIAFVARNGSGKSTLLKIIAGKDQADSGTVWVHKNVKVIMLLQETAFENDLSIWDNVLNMDNDIVNLVKEYEILMEQEVHDEDRMRCDPMKPAPPVMRILWCIQEI
jgi:ATP-binding cassette subfamily F protein uup